MPSSAEREREPNVGAVELDPGSRKLVEELRRRARQQEAVAELGLRALAEPDLDALFGEAAALVARTLEVEHADVLELAPGGEMLVRRAGAATTYSPVGASIPTTGQAGYTLRSAAPVVVDDLETETRFAPSLTALARGARSGISCVIHGEGAPFGVIGAHASTSGSFSEDDAHFLQAVANVLASAVRRRRAEQELGESERRLRELLESVQLIVGSLDLEGRITYCNRFGAETLGWSREELIGRDWWEVTSSSTDREGFLESLSTRALPPTYESTLRTRRGETRVIRWNSSILLDPSGTVVGSMGIGDDITDRRRAEARLREASERFRGAFGAAPIGMALIALDDRYLQVNRAYCELLGYSEDELIGRRSVEITHPDDVALTDDADASLVEGATLAYELEKRYLHRDGHIVPVLLSESLVRGADGEPLYFISHVQDLSERKRAEEQRDRLEQELRQAQKLEAVGRLAGGVAHDFNNLLLAIGGYSDLALDESADPDELRRDIQEIKRACDRATSLTRQLLAFSRRQVLEPEVLDVNDVVEEMELMLRRLIGEDVELLTQLEEESGSVLADRGQLEQVIVNLALNARDAMPDGGTLTISTRRVELDESWGEGRALEPGPYVVLAVADTGQGMDEETRLRAFEPFFTTKDQGKGTGLGLATVHGIVRQSGGDIWVTTELGRGTTIRVGLPCVEARVRPEEAAPAAHPPGGSETILLVEDNELVRGLVIEMLRRLGYRVLPASSGAEALELFHANRGLIELVLTDLVMPKMSGHELSRRLRRVEPDLPVLYMSGYSEEAILPADDDLRAAAFLEKPFSARDLARTVRRVLDSRS